MPNAAKRICNAPGCMTVCEDGWCEKHKRQREDYHKQTFRERGYDSHWTELSASYRRENPLCVMCLSQGRVKPAQCVDHIIPVTCCPDLIHDADNLQSACTRCNTNKKFSDPKGQWTPIANRIVVCGLPGTGKTTYAKATGYPYWDTDERPELRTIDDVQRARTQWIASLSKHAACVVIVASTITAPHVAQAIQGTVKHMTTQYVTRDAQWSPGGG